MVRTAASRGVQQKHMVTTRAFLFKQLQMLPAKLAFFMQFFLTQALADDSRLPHTAFNAMGIDCLTVGNVGQGSEVSAEAFFGTIEATLFSLLSLQESLHQSFYFYVLPSAWTYVPIGDYMIVFALCFLIFPAVVLWFAIYSQALSSGVVWSELELVWPFLAGVLLWKSPSHLAAVSAYAACLLAVLFGVGKTRRETHSDLLMLVATVYLGVALVLGVLVNFPFAIVGCVFGVLQLIAYRLRSRVVFLLLDPFLLSGGMAMWPSMFLVAVPVRLMMAQIFAKQ